MKNQYKSFKAFTLIELLIVIALLGALAVGLLAALDPFEQLKKGTDTGIRNTVSEVHGAIIRYYAVAGNMMPWHPSTSIGPINLSTGYSTDIGLNKVVDSGELKKDFSTLAGDRLQKITLIGTNESVTVCFRPESKSFRSDPNTKYNDQGIEIGTGDAVCGPKNSAQFSCYWCVQ
ncbi:MAG: prepilin-type N-terminal cleavage/methylation domain-containing protein [Patescibacteria group bacterium]|nr:prepilin-type N-terminal cleavage/methylation domain-containing protein [Patescibacteria group bacterium]